MNSLYFLSKNSSWANKKSKRYFIEIMRRAIFYFLKTLGTEMILFAIYSMANKFPFIYFVNKN